MKGSTNLGNHQVKTYNGIRIYAVVSILWFLWSFQIQVKEVILQDTDVAQALTEYITQKFITTIVTGTSARNALTRYEGVLVSMP